MLDIDAILQLVFCVMAKTDARWCDVNGSAAMAIGLSVGHFAAVSEWQSHNSDKSVV